MFFYICQLYTQVLLLPMFTLNLAYVNDFIQKEKFVAAGAGLQIIFGIGAMGGPFLCSIVYEFLWCEWFFYLFSYLSLN